MKSDAIINGKVVELNDNEKKEAEEFHKKRCAFAWIDGKLTFNDNENDDRDHQHWLLDDYGITPEQWEKLPRGYMLPDRIQLFIGSTFSAVPTDSISVTDFAELISKHHTRYKSKEVKIYNGVKIGKVGEVWEPITCLGTF